jgi:hypothetical protein
LNNFLFIDFGASKVKTIQYNIQENTFCNQKQIDSPFLENETIHKKKLLIFLTSIIEQYEDIDGIVACSILGGGYHEDVYYSWKVDKKLEERTCLISELFRRSKNYHIHKDHGGEQDVLGLLGKLDGINFYSSLGDTDCVKRSFPLDNKSCIVNLGTGSQVIKPESIVKYIPSGRALNTYRSFFMELGIDVFGMFEQIKLEDLLKSQLHFNLNIFNQALDYKDPGGAISGVHESNFTVKNFINSMFASYLNQYIPYIIGSDRIYLTGGISRRYPIIKKYFEIKTGKDVFLRSEYIEDTFLGIRNKLLEDYEYINNRR